MPTLEQNQALRYKQDNNFKIVNISAKKLCYVFCSSNGIYAGVNNENCDEYFKKDYYEFENISKSPKIMKTAGKYIFLRDPKVKFYIEGINAKINTIDKIIKLVRDATEGYELIVVGYSSGGTLAIILGNLLDNVKRIFTFGAIFSLYSFTGAKNEYLFKETEIFKKHKDDSTYSKWYSLEKVLEKNKTPTYHFYGSDSVCDQIQLREIKATTNIYLIPIQSISHGGNFHGFFYPFLLTYNDKKIQKLRSKKPLKTGAFELRSLGLIRFVTCLIKKLLVKY